MPRSILCVSLYIRRTRTGDWDLDYLFIYLLVFYYIFSLNNLCKAKGDQLASANTKASLKTKKQINCEQQARQRENKTIGNNGNKKTSEKTDNYNMFKCFFKCLLKAREEETDTILAGREFHRGTTL